MEFRCAKVGRLEPWRTWRIWSLGKWERFRHCTEKAPARGGGETGAGTGEWLEGSDCFVTHFVYSFDIREGLMGDAGVKAGLEVKAIEKVP